jgi:hypothetical protein
LHWGYASGLQQLGLLLWGSLEQLAEDDQLLEVFGKEVVPLVAGVGYCGLQLFPGCCLQGIKAPVAAVYLGWWVKSGKER